MSEEKRATNEQGSVPNEQPTPAYQLTKLELKRRLKHIAGLCYSLVCDISNVEIEAEQLRAENEYLRRKLGKEETTLQRNARLERQREYARKRYAARKAAETPEEREKRLQEKREENRVYRAARKARTGEAQAKREETPEQLEKRLAYMREYMRKKNAEKKAQNATRSGEDGKPEQDA